MQMTQLDPLQAVLPVRKQNMIPFIYTLFDSEFGNPLKLSRNHFLGRFITSLRTYSDFPVKQQIPKDWIPVVVEFPNSTYSTADRRFIYFNMECVEIINDAIQATFDLHFYLYFFNSASLAKLAEEISPDAELTKSDVVESFIVGYNLVDFGSPYDQIKKRDYRTQMKIFEAQKAALLKKAYRYLRKILENQHKFLKNIKNQQVKK